MKTKDLNDKNQNFPGKDDITAHFIIQNFAFAKEEFGNAIYLGIHDIGFIQRKKR